MIKLSVEPVADTGIIEPVRLIICATHKVGKTELVTKLPKHFIVDGEDSLQHFPGAVGFNVVRESKSGKYTKAVPTMERIGDHSVQKIEAGKPVFHRVNMSQTELVLTEIPAAIQKMNQENGGVPVFDFIILDTLTYIETLARGLGTAMFKKTIAGKNFKGDDVATGLGDGNGWDWPRKATWALLEAYEGLAGKCLIMNAHIKDTQIASTEGGTIISREISATGKMKILLPAKWDGIGYLYRSAINENTITFETKKNDNVSGIRNKFLSGKKFVISVLNEDQSLTTYWERIFPSIKEQS